MRPTVAFVPLYFTLFDRFMPAELRERRERMAARIADLLAGVDLRVTGLVDSVEAAREAASKVAAAAPDGIVLLPTMASPPEYAWTVAEACPDTPLLVVCGQESARVPHPYDTDRATERSAPVGAMMVTNVLARQGRQYAMVTGDVNGQAVEAGLSEWLAGLGAAVAVRSLRVGAFGEPIPGYDDVVTTPAELEAIGVELVQVTSGDLEERYGEATPASYDDLIEALGVEPDSSSVGEEVLERSLRLWSTLRSLTLDLQLEAGTVNCHGQLFRDNKTIGITACTAVTALSSQGIPFSCTGDVPTAIALAVGNLIAGAALYGELYQLDIEENWVLFANGGEGDVRCAASTPRLLHEDHYAGEHGPGVAVAFDVEPGPAMLLSLTPQPTAEGGWALVAAAGEIVGADHPELEGPHGRFRFANHEVRNGFEAYAKAGATHHSALIPGIHSFALGTFANAVGIELRVV